jgi:hypothetical protein
MKPEKRCEANVRSYKKLVAPISVALLLIIAGLAFLDLQPNFVGPPPILDPNFQLWVGEVGARRLMVWDMEYVKGPSDSVSLSEAVVGGKSAAQLLVRQSSIDGAPVYVYLKQSIDGARLTELFESDIGLWVLAEACRCNSTSTARSIIFGVELNDGVHVLTFIFSDQTIEARTILAHRFVYLTTQSGAWTYQHIDLSEQYAMAHWGLPDRVSFSLVFEAGELATGQHSAYVNSIHVAKVQVNSEQYGFSGSVVSEFLFCDGRHVGVASAIPELRMWQ